MEHNKEVELKYLNDSQHNIKGVRTQNIQQLHILEELLHKIMPRRSNNNILVQANSSPSILPLLKTRFFHHGRPYLIISQLISYISFLLTLFI